MRGFAARFAETPTETRVSPPGIIARMPIRIRPDRRASLAGQRPQKSVRPAEAATKHREKETGADTAPVPHSIIQPSRSRSSSDRKGFRGQCRDAHGRRPLSSPASIRFPNSLRGKCLMQTEASDPDSTPIIAFRGFLSIRVSANLAGIPRSAESVTRSRAPSPPVSRRTAIESATPPGSDCIRPEAAPGASRASRRNVSRLRRNGWSSE